MSAVDPDFAKRLVDIAAKRGSVAQPAAARVFHGRTTIAEILVVDDATRGLFKRGITDRDIEIAARNMAWKHCCRTDCAKSLSGDTTSPKCCV